MITFLLAVFVRTPWTGTFVVWNLINLHTKLLGSPRYQGRLESGYLFLRCSVLVQRFNAILLHDRLPASDCTDWWSYPLLPFQFLKIPPEDIYRNEFFDVCPAVFVFFLVLDAVALKHARLSCMCNKLLTYLLTERWCSIHKGPFIATQLNSTSSCVVGL